MNRRQFLRGAGAAGAGLVATATMAEAGALAEFYDWLRRRPVFSFASKKSEPILFFSGAFGQHWRGTISYAMLQDSAFDLEQYLRAAFSSRMARMIDAELMRQSKMVYSAGSPPRGILSANGIHSGDTASC